jgi:hypothetical protein
MKNKVINSIFFAALKFGRIAIDLENKNKEDIKLYGPIVLKTLLYQTRILKAECSLLIGRILLRLC